MDKKHDVSKPIVVNEITPEEAHEIAKESRRIRQKLQEHIDRAGRLPYEDVRRMLRFMEQDLTSALRVLEKARQRPTKEFLDETIFTV